MQSAGKRTAHVDTRIGSGGVILRKFEEIKMVIFAILFNSKCLVLQKSRSRSINMLYMNMNNTNDKIKIRGIEGYCRVRTQI